MRGERFDEFSVVRESRTWGTVHRNANSREFAFLCMHPQTGDFRLCFMHASAGRRLLSSLPYASRSRARLEIISRTQIWRVYAFSIILRSRGSTRTEELPQRGQVRMPGTGSSAVRSSRKAEMQTGQVYNTVSAGVMRPRSGR